jgi:DNA modification methylase
MPKRAPNQLYYGDNLDVLRRHVGDESVDLVYLDPPFKSDQDYNVLFADRGTKSAAQVKVFEDTWSWDESAARAYQETVETGGQIAKAMVAFRELLGPSDMLAYLSMMAPRLVELRRVLKETGTIYLHCDATASAHLRLLMDAIFTPKCFLNEIIWHYQTSSGAPKKWLHRNHDTILRYAARDPKLVVWHHPREPWPESTLKKWQRDEEGRIYRVQNKFGKRYYIDPRGKLGDDVWDITLSSRTRERLGYPTQKPEALLSRIIKASSDEGGVVLDPFCGCGTAIAAAAKLKRHWVGIDITHLAINLIRHRLLVDGFAESYDVIGEPVTLDDAEALAKEDAFQFEWWALGLVGARPIEGKKGADRGVDGRLYFHEESDAPKQIVLSVKSGKVGPTAVRDLRGVVERDKANIAVLLTLQQPTQPMRAEAASGGFYESENGRFYPRVQILTIDELLKGAKIDYPVTGTGRAIRPDQPEQLRLEPTQPQTEGAAQAPKSVPELVEDLLDRARVRRAPVRMEPILEQLGMELNADPNLREEALLVPMTDPERGPVRAWMVYYNPKRSSERRRFTLAHEVGHVMLHGQPQAAAARGGGGRNTKREREAERFAAELLMPTRLVREAVDKYGVNVETLRALFEVSAAAMQIRLRELGYA